MGTIKFIVGVDTIDSIVDTFNKTIEEHRTGIIVKFTNNLFVYINRVEEVDGYCVDQQGRKTFTISLYEVPIQTITKLAARVKENKDIETSDMACVGSLWLKEGEEIIFEPGILGEPGFTVIVNSAQQ